MSDPSLIYADQWNEQDNEDVMRLAGPILVVGAAGFIGTNLFFSLVKRRKDVFAICRNQEHNWRLKKFPPGVPESSTISADITDPLSIRDVLQRYKPKTVFNLAAYGAYERQADISRIHQVNYMGTLNLLSLLFEQGCEAFVQAGSSSEYGLNCSAPNEDDSLIPNSEYAVSKVSASYLIKYYGRVKGFPAINLRLYSVYGPWEERDRLIPTVIKSGVSGFYPPLASPEISRDFIYVDDCTRAFVRAAVTACRSAPGSSINIASGKKMTLRQVALISKESFQLKQDPTFKTMENRKWDLAEWYGNPAKARELMDFQARIDFTEGFNLTKNWELAASELIRFDHPTTTNRKLSIVIACYRDHEAIPVMYKRLTDVLRSIGYDYEIIFVNDSSPTHDEKIIHSICREDTRVIGISHSRNFGSQSAFLSGMEIASGHGIVLMDGDLQDPPELIPAFVKKWEDKFDVVYGNRIQREAPIYMQVFYKIFYRVFRRLSEFNMPLDAGDFSLIDRKVVDYLIEFRERDVFLRGLRAWVGFKQTGVPYLRLKRPFGTTTNSFLKNIWWAKKAIFSFSIKPLEYIQRLGVVTFVCSCILAIIYILNYFIHPPTSVHGFYTIVVLILGLGGVQLISLSVLGDYLGKVLEEVKSRPRFVRARIFKGFDVYEARSEIEKFVIKSQENTKKARDTL